MNLNLPILTLGLTLAAAPVLAAPATQPSSAKPPEHTSFNDLPQFVEITPAARNAIDRGLAFLAKDQADDGSFGARQFPAHVGITALACLAFMEDGNMPGRGRYGTNVQRGVKFILDHATESGLLTGDTPQGPMYGHGFATLLLGEVYGMTHDPRIRPALLKAVRLIINSQNSEGGWRYQPVPVDADISVTICQIMALRSARNAGISVPKDTIDRAIAYVRACQEPDGGFRYMLNAGGSAYPRSAAGVASLYYAGVYKGDALTRGLDYLLNNSNGGAFNGGHYFYGNYYAVQAMFLAGGKYWKQWFPPTRDALIRRQQQDGSWQAGQGDAYGTAMALLVLQVPNRLLPIFQR